MVPKYPSFMLLKVKKFWRPVALQRGFIYNFPSGEFPKHTAKKKESLLLFRVKTDRKIRVND